MTLENINMRRICLFILLAAWPATAQDNTFRTTVPLIVAPASVTDRHGKPVYGLTAADFELLDNGTPRTVQVSVADDGLAPVAVVLAIQTTDTSLSAIGKIRKVGALIQSAVVGEGGEAAVLTFDQDVTLVQDFTREDEDITRVFRDLKPSESESGRMIDAVSQAIDMLAHRPGARRASIVIVGESKDRGSQMKVNELLAKAQHSDVTVYSISYSAYLTPFTTRAEDYQPPAGGGLIKAIGELARNAKENTVEALTDATGGRRFGFATKGKLENDLIGLGTDLHARYWLSFRPDFGEQHETGKTSEDGSSAPQFHHLELHVKNHPDAVIRMRSGYWTPN